MPSRIAIKPKITKKSVYKFIWMLEVKAPRIPSTPYVKGFKAVKVYNIFGMLFKGNKVPDKKNKGIIKKFIIMGKDCISSNLEAMEIPKAVNAKDIKNIKSKAKGAKIQLGENPKNKVIIKTIKPCITATVAPPNVFPIII